LNIVFLSTEAVPLAKTGGLADVCGALPTQLARRGHQVSLIMPAFRSIYASGIPIEPTEISFALPMRGSVVGARLLKAELPGGDDNPVEVYFIDQPQYYDRPSLYGDASGDYPDNCERFAFFCRGAVHAIERLGRPVDIVHCNDWQTGLVPAYMTLEETRRPWMKRARSVLTIHNLAYQGHFWHWDYPLTGLDWKHFRPEGLEFYGHLNMLKTGIVYADKITTVSPTYAKEIQSELHGCGLDPLLRSRSDVLHGITNGIDDEIWNPATDKYLRLPHQRGLPPAPSSSEPGGSGNYDVDTWEVGKAIQKRRLQEAFDLRVDPELPLIGLVGRLAGQKGWDLIIEVLRGHLEQTRPTQWVILGTGEPRYHEQLTALASIYPERFGLKLGFSDELAHQIEAAADIFVMPSRYEPCGLNQLYSLRYGTVPVVTATGGLVDTVVDATPENLAAGTATGFHVREFSAAELDRTLGLALQMRFHDKKNWRTLVESGMRQDWSWGKSAAQYEKLYAATIPLTPPGDANRRRLARHDYAKFGKK